MGGAPGSAHLCSRDSRVGYQAELGVRTSQPEAPRMLGSQEALALSQHAWQGAGGPAAHRAHPWAAASSSVPSRLISETRAS